MAHAGNKQDIKYQSSALPGSKLQRFYSLKEWNSCKARVETDFDGCAKDLGPGLRMQMADADGRSKPAGH